MIKVYLISSLMFLLVGTAAMAGQPIQTDVIKTSGGDLELTDYVMQDASYIAFRDFTLGYQVPVRIAKSLKLSSIRAYCTATNLFYIMGSDYKGVNPEARFTTGPYSKAFPLVSGYQRGTYPLTKAFTLGIDVNF